MGTDQLLDLFSLDTNSTGTTEAKTDSKSQGNTSVKNILENMEELWDDKQYETEYNLDAFMKSLHK